MANSLIDTAMILAAGLGERMRPLTDTIPKPLLQVKGKALIQYNIEALVRAGIKTIVINHSRLGYMIEEKVGDGSEYGVEIKYSAEGDTPLETAGGIIKALPLLNSERFIVVNADIYTDYDFSDLKAFFNQTAHLVLVNNPVHNAKGDFALNNNQILNQSEEQYTFSGIASYNKSFFKDLIEGKLALAPILRKAVEAKQVSGQLYQGNWIDVGTPQRLEEANHTGW